MTEAVVPPARGKRRGVLVAAGVLAIAVLVAVVLFLRSGPSETRYLTEASSLFDSASATAKAVASLDAGAAVEVSGCEGGWCRVRSQGRKGFVPEGLLTREPPMRFVWAGMGVLRNAPDYAAEVIRTFEIVDGVAFLGSANERFSKVRLGDGLEGYVPSHWLNPALPTLESAKAAISAAEDNDEKVRIASALVRVVGDDPASHELLIAALEKANDPTELEAARLAHQQAVIAFEASKTREQLKTAEDGIVLRTSTARRGPGIEHEVLKTLGLGDEVRVLGEVRTGRNGLQWAKIALGEKPGWIAAADVVTPAREAPKVTSEQVKQRRKTVTRQVATLSEKGCFLASEGFRETAYRFGDSQRRAELAQLLVTFFGQTARHPVFKGGRLSPKVLCEVWGRFAEDPQDFVRERAHQAMLGVASTSPLSLKNARCTRQLEEAVRMLPAQGTAKEHQLLRELSVSIAGLSRASKRILATAPGSADPP